LFVAAAIVIHPPNNCAVWNVTILPHVECHYLAS
jgi:hypothetical protein